MVENTNLANKRGVNKINREVRTKLVKFKDDYFTEKQLKEDLNKAGAVVRLQFYKILLDFTVTKPATQPNEDNDFIGIDLADNKDKTERKIYTFEEMNGQRKIEQSNGKATG